MSRWTNQEIDDFLIAIDVCPEGYVAMKELATYGMSVDDAINQFKNNGYPRFAKWLEGKKDTEAYVRFNGKEIKMGAFKVHNPFTGLHAHYETEEEARAAMLAIYDEIVNTYRPTLVREISNENGDATWIPAELSNPIQVV